MIGLLTLNPIMYNYGGFLQELALQDALIKMGYNIEIINYNPAEELNTFSAKRGIKYFTFDKFLAMLNPRKENKMKECVASEISVRHKSFDRYRKQELRLSEKIEYGDLHSDQLPYSIYVCGSDQIWNPDYNIPAFFLDFVEDKNRKVIYAASFGKTTLTKREGKRYCELLDGLKYVSVREETAQALVEKISRKKAEVVVDPTLLHTTEYWEEKAKSSNKEYKDYVFCYFLDLTREKFSAAQRYASKLNCKIVMIPYLHNREDELFGDIHDSNVAPNDFLKLIKDATAILTDSFHATVFSLVFNKKFWVFGRNAGSYNMNTRIDSLLKMYNAEERLIEPNNLGMLNEPKVLYDDEAVIAARKHSFDFLDNALAYDRENEKI